MTTELGEVTIAQLQNEMAAGARTAASITEGYLAAIDAVDDALCSVIETNPDAPRSPRNWIANARPAMCAVRCTVSRSC